MMLDLDAVNIPPFKVKFRGEVYEYDALELLYEAQKLDGLGPKEVAEAVTRMLKLPAPLTPAQAFAVGKELQEFLKQHEDKLKKVFGAQLSWHTITGSNQESSAQKKE